MINLKNTVITLSTETLFEIPSFKLGHGDKFALLAPNGTGKSVFMKKLFTKEIMHSMRISYCAQQLSASWRDSSMEDWLKESDEDFNINEYYRLCQFFNLDTNRPVATFSGGQERKASLIYTLCQNAEAFFFDEPTNHLDVQSILWLEGYIAQNVKTYFIISHDLMFVDKLVDGYWAIHEGLMRYYHGNYSSYLQKRETEESSLASEMARKKVALQQEERYRERGVTARRSRNQKRLEKLNVLREEMKRNRKEDKLQFAEIGNKDMPSQLILKIVDFIPTFFSETAMPLPAITRNITRKDKIAIVGENGRGKTTLIKNLLDINNPNVTQRVNIKIASLDQHRSMDEDLTPVEIVSHGKTYVSMYVDNKEQEIHPLSYLKRFGIHKDQAMSQYANLSGGEKMKVCLARMLSSGPVDVLVLDEPTNDLDIEAIEELSDLLLQFNGLVLLVTHDRYLIDQCATETWYLGPHEIVMHPGGFEERFISAFASNKVAKAKNNNHVLIKEIEKQEQLVKKIDLKLSENHFYDKDGIEELVSLQAKRNLLISKIDELYMQLY